MSRHLWSGLPLLAIGVGGAGFFEILRHIRAGTYDPHSLPSPLVGQHPPDFNLPCLNEEQGFSNKNLLTLPKPVLINWFASWCMPCRQEAPLLSQLAASGIAIWGIAYEDSPSAIAAYLQAFGNPYQRLAFDQSGLTAINWGVYGVPETYFIDKNGIIRCRYAGPLNRDIIKSVFMPLFASYS